MKTTQILIAGFGGQGRYPNTPGQEELNKTFIIQIIPYIK